LRVEACLPGALPVLLLGAPGQHPCVSTVWQSPPQTQPSQAQAHPHLHPTPLLGQIPPPLPPSPTTTRCLTWYFMVSLHIPFCCCSRILTTSKGVTMTSASVTPGPPQQPAHRQ
jgi:hypothetical protein